MPYAVTQAQLRPAQAGNPFETGHRAAGNAGFDLKIGLKSNLTLDATVNPDFGQVEVDPAVLNLSAYETYYQEKRPFFIEGASLFNNFGRGGVFINANINWPQPRFFYSRRIGRAPQGYVTEDGFARVPDRSTILGAAKLTGKLGGSWNVGWLNAVTGREFAQIDQLGTRLSQEVEPLTYYGALRVQKDFDEGRHGLGLMATGVARDLGDERDAGRHPQQERRSRSAADGWVSLDKKKDWVVGGWAGATRVAGTARGHLAPADVVDALFPAARRDPRRGRSDGHEPQRLGGAASTWPSRAGTCWCWRAPARSRRGSIRTTSASSPAHRTSSTCSSCRATSGPSRARSSGARSCSGAGSATTTSRATRSGTAGSSSSRGS
ncbi:MAG: DUF5916 domain-containing protein [Sphingobacterium sp.]|nr:DUF5916 domain-containing protein [Sphingobacterium sp.]